MNLVTGATGHIGNVLVRWLRQRGEAVRALVLPGEDLTPLAPERWWRADLPRCHLMNSSA